MKKLLASAAMAAAMSIGGGSIAHATTYILDVTALPAGNYGTVTVTGSGTSTITFDVQLASGVFFTASGNGVDSADAFWFDIVGNPTIDTSGFNTGTKFNNPTNLAASSDAAPGFSDFDYAIDWVGPPTSNSNLAGNGGVQHLIFSVTNHNGGNITLDSGTQNGTGTPVFAVADIAYGCNVDGCTGTGLVGATTGGGIPEPASWAMMIVGFFGVGSLLRKRRTAAATA